MSKPLDAWALKEKLTMEAYEEFWDAIWDLDEQYGLPLTNNEPRIKDGRQLHEIAEFGMDVLEIAAKVINALKADVL